MKYNTPEISWHSRDPVYSVDFQPGKHKIQRVATCGMDSHVRVWEVKVDKEGKGQVEFLSSLSRHARTVNVVRFSPDGKFLASGGDDSSIILWKQSESPTPQNSIFGEEDEENRETWGMVRALRSHLEGVYDLSWSSDSKHMLSGSIDNTAILWDVKKGQRIWIFTEHKSFVQGVAFDPLDHYLVTLSNDRSCRVFTLQNRACVHNISKMTLPTTENEKPKSFKMFYDDTLKHFFRRLSFSPDGQLLVVPSGCMEQTQDQATTTHSTSYVFTRASMSKPVLQLPAGTKASIVIRFCPVLFDLRTTPRKDDEKKCETSKTAEHLSKIQVDELMETEEIEKDKVEKISRDSDTREEWEKYNTIFRLSYRMVFAVATENSVALYDTQQTQPFAFLRNIHYAGMNDLSWSSDGRMLMIASSDGFCTVVTFAEGELGKPYKDQPVSRTTEEPVTNSKAKDQKQHVKTSTTPSQPPKPAAPSDSKARRVQVTTLVTADPVASDSPQKPAPRRVQMTTLKSFSDNTDNCANIDKSIPATAAVPSVVCTPTTPSSKDTKAAPTAALTPTTPGNRKNGAGQTSKITPRRVQIVTIDKYKTHPEPPSTENCETSDLHLELEATCDIPDNSTASLVSSPSISTSLSQEGSSSITSTPSNSGPSSSQEKTSRRRIQTIMLDS